MDKDGKIWVMGPAGLEELGPGEPGKVLQPHRTLLQKILGFFGIEYYPNWESDGEIVE